MKKQTILLGIGVCMALAFSSCKSSESAYKKAYEKAQQQELAEQSKALNGSIICRELLGLDHKSDAPTPEARTEAYYKRRPCADYEASAARLIGEKLNQEICKE